MKSLPARPVKERPRATAIEYGLIAALIAVAIVAGASALGGSIDGLFATMNSATVGTAAQ